MFKTFREMRELKKASLRLQYLLLSKVYDFVEGFPDILELAKRAKSLDTNELQKLITTELVKYIKKDEEIVTNVDKVGE